MEKDQVLSINKDSKLITDTNIYDIEILDLELPKNHFNDETAYLSNGYYYLYRGEVNLNKTNIRYLKPGIYFDSNNKDLFLIEPITEEQLKEYSADEKISSIIPTNIIDIVNEKDDILIAIPESTKIFMPTLTAHDDILKRLAKQCLIKKNVDLDKYKDRFVDKNALFNFKQVIKGENKLSILIFDRGMDAMNLEYKIEVMEKDPDNYIGERLDDPIIATSEDTFNV